MVVVVVIVVVVIVVVVIVVVVIVVVVVVVVVQISGLYRSVMLGKTQFAKSSRGVEEALVVPCQNATSPFLKDFRRGEHKAIVFDEVSSECIHANKAVFQANSDTVVLGQSPCQAHLRILWQNACIPAMSSCRSDFYFLSEFEKIPTPN